MRKPKLTSRQKILKYFIERKGDENRIRPTKLASKLKINPKTTRNMCALLAKDGKLYTWQYPNHPEQEYYYLREDYT